MSQNTEGILVKLAQLRTELVHSNIEKDFASCEILLFRKTY